MDQLHSIELDTSLFTTTSSMLETRGPNVADTETTVKWLSKFLSTSEYSELVQSQEIDGESLRLLANSKDELMHFGITKLGHVLKLHNYFQTSDLDTTQLQVHVPVRGVPVPARGEVRVKTCLFGKESCTVKMEPNVRVDRKGSPDELTSLYPKYDIEQLTSSVPMIRDRKSSPNDCNSLHSKHDFEELTSSVHMSSTRDVFHSTQWPSYDDIFKHRAAGKRLLKAQFPNALRDLNRGHAVIRSWFKDYEKESLLHDILHLDFKIQPDMKALLNDFIESKLQELPPLVFGNETDTYTMRWKHHTVYVHIITHRQEFKKSLKRKQVSLSSDKIHKEVKVQKQCDPLARLMNKQPELMAEVFKGGKISFFGLKDRPTSEQLIGRESDLPGQKNDKVKLIGMGVPEGLGQEFPYVTFLIRVTHLERGYSKSPIAAYFLPHCVTTRNNPSQVHDLQLNVVVEIARSYVRLVTESNDFELFHSTTWITKQSEILESPTEANMYSNEGVQKSSFRTDCTEKTLHAEGSRKLHMELPTSDNKEIFDHEEVNVFLHRRKKIGSENFAPDTYHQERKDCSENTSPTVNLEVNLPIDPTSEVSLRSADNELDIMSRPKRSKPLTEITNRINLQCDTVFELELLENIVDKLSSDALKIAALVLVDVKTIDQLAMNVNSFIARQNKRNTSKKVFVGHAKHNLEKKLEMIVRWALDEKYLTFIGKVRMIDQRLQIERQNIKLLKKLL